MSKPLELTIYPPAEKEPLPSDSDWLGWDDWRAWNRANTYESHKRQGKRLKEAELCAEYWRHEGDYRMLTDGYQIESFSMTDHGMPPWATETLECDRVNTLHRFATRPHYFEATEPESDTE